MRKTEHPVELHPDLIVRPIDGSPGSYRATMQKRFFGWLSSYEFSGYGGFTLSPVGGMWPSVDGCWRPTRRLAERAISRLIAKQAGYLR